MSQTPTTEPAIQPEANLEPTMSQQTSSPEGSPGPWWCPPTVHNRYFDGKFMTAEDFALDPDYATGHRHTANRLFVGWGVAIGLGVRWARNGRLRVAEGLAIDPQGRELVADRPLVVDVRRARCQRNTLVALHYHRRAIDPQSRLFDGAEPTRAERVRGERGSSEPGRWLDTVRTGLFEDVEGWQVPEPWVPVARLVRDRDGRRALEVAGRPDLELRPTRIRRIDWPHGGTLDAERLWRRDGVLSITFDHPLGPAHEGFGIGPDSLRLAIGRPQGSRHPLRGRVWSQGPVAYFQLDPRHRHDLGQHRGAHLYLTLQCDAVLDHLHRRVSAAPPWVGRHLPATPGGTFESWLRIDHRSQETGTSPTAAVAPTSVAGPAVAPTSPPGPDGIRHLGVIDVNRLAREGEDAYQDPRGGDEAGHWLLPHDDDPWRRR